MKKKFLKNYVLLFVFIALLCCFSACNGDANVNSATENVVGTEGILYYVKEGEDYATVVGYDGMETDIRIASSYEGLPVTEIGWMAFRDCRNLTNIVLPNSVTTIQDQAFSDCSALTGVEFGDGLKKIGSMAFYGCGSLKNIIIPDSVANFGSDVFSSIDVSEYNEYDNAYYLGNENNPYHVLVEPKATDITGCDIYSSTRVIANGAFSYCKKLENITLPDSTMYIGYSSFYNCSDLTDIVIGDGVRDIGAFAFYKCENLTSIVIPNGVENIGDSIFAECSNLNSVVIGEGVGVISASAFAGCGNLTSVVMGDAIEIISRDAFYRCGKLSSLVIPYSVTKIEKEAFGYCRTLTLYCRAESKLDGWHEEWDIMDFDKRIPVVWGYKGE